jgi:hypothetical protein
MTDKVAEKDVKEPDPNKVTVQFVRNRSPYNTGDIATFDAAQAQSLASSGHAVAVSADTMKEYHDRQMKSGRPAKDVVSGRKDDDVDLRGKDDKAKEAKAKSADEARAKAGEEAEDAAKGRKRL